MPGIQNSKGTLNMLNYTGDYDRGDKVQFNNVSAALVELADYLIVRARANLKKGGHVASGNTANSMKAGPLQTNGTRLQVDISLDANYKFIDQGVKGVNGGWGKYKFKHIYPGKKMVQAIGGWLRVRGIATKYKAIVKDERKNQGIKRMTAGKTGKQKLALAYAIATNIKKKGIKPTYFFEDAIEETKKYRKRILAEAIKLDIIETFN